MATDQPALTVGRGLEAVRITRLTDSGARGYCNQADTSAFSMCPQSISRSESVEAGETQTIRCGGGDVYATFTTEDSVSGVELRLTLVSVDIEFIALATGATILRHPTTDNIGWSGGTDSGRVVELHAWQNAYSGSANAASPYQYWHHAWPYVQFRLGQDNLEEGFGVTTLIGKVQGNLNLGNGSFLDIPADAFESSTHFHAQWRDNDLPDVANSPYNNAIGGGFITTPACAS